jgi:hypothetical protein
MKTDDDKFLERLGDLELADLYRAVCHDPFGGQGDRVRAIEAEALQRMAREWLQEQQPHPFPYGPDNPEPATFAADLDDDLPL